MRKGGSSRYDSLAALGLGSAPADCRYHCSITGCLGLYLCDAREGLQGKGYLLSFGTDAFRMLQCTAFKDTITFYNEVNVSLKAYKKIHLNTDKNQHELRLLIKFNVVDDFQRKRDFGRACVSL